MKQIKFIGVTGEARHGKDSFANLVCAPHNFRSISFPDPLKGAALAMYAMRSKLDGYSGKRLERLILDSYYEAFGDKKSFAMRDNFQAAGKKSREEHDPGILIDIAMREAWKLVDKGHGVVLPNVRMPNEAAFLYGQCHTMQEMYEARRKAGEPVEEDIAWRLTHYRFHTHNEYGKGLVPYPGQSAIVRVIRPGFDNGLTEAQKNHDTERHVADLPVDFEIHQRSLGELQEQGFAVMGQLGLRLPLDYHDLQEAA